MSVVLCVCAALPVTAQKATLNGVTDEVKRAAAEQSAAQSKASGEQAAAIGQVAQRQRAAESSAIERAVNSRVASTLAAEKLELRLEKIEEALTKSEKDKATAAAEEKEDHAATMRVVQESMGTLLCAMFLGGLKILYSLVTDKARHEKVDGVLTAMQGKVADIAKQTNGMTDELVRLAGAKKFREGMVAGVKQERAVESEEKASHGR
jgi:hypothetical protein